MQLTEQQIREIMRDEIKAALEERDAANKTALIDLVKKLCQEPLDFTDSSRQIVPPIE